MRRIVRRSVWLQVLIAILALPGVAVPLAGFAAGDIGSALFTAAIWGLPSVVVLARLPRAGVEVARGRVIVRGYFVTKVFAVEDVVEVSVAEDSTSILPAAGVSFALKDGSDVDPPCVTDFAFTERGVRRVEAKAAVIRERISASQTAEARADAGDRPSAD